MMSKRRLTLRTQPRPTLSLLLLCLCAAVARPDQPTAPPLLTVAEKSDYKATSRHAEVVDICERLRKFSPLIRLGELGKSGEGRKLPLVILADPPVSTPEEAARAASSSSSRWATSTPAKWTARKPC